MRKDNNSNEEKWPKRRVNVFWAKFAYNDGAGIDGGSQGTTGMVDGMFFYIIDYPFY